MMAALCTLCSTLASLLGGQELALQERTRVRVCRKKRNSPTNEILTKDVDEAWKIQKHSVKARNVGKFCSETQHLKIKSETEILY